MTWPRALGYLAAALVLAIVYFGTAKPPPPSPAEPPPASVPSAPAPPVIDTIRLDAGGRTVLARRSGEVWKVIEPAGAELPSDLISALVGAVMDTPAQPVTSDAERLHEFGLDSPSARLTFERPGAAPVTLLLGGANPSATGVYGRLDGNPQVVLLGLNVRYYIDLVLRQSGT